MATIHIDLFSLETKEAEEKIERVVEIVNTVYAKTEGDLWKDQVERTTFEQIKQLALERELAVAYINEKIVGCVRMKKVDTQTGEYGMLAVDEKYQGRGIGRKLIQFVEQTFIKDNLKTIRLELLHPIKKEHPYKVRLKNWYQKLGYQTIDSMPIETIFPELKDAFVTPCQFMIMQKSL